MVCFYAAVLGCVLMADSVQVEGENVKIGVDLMVGPIPVQDMLTKKPRPTRSFYLQCALMVQDTSSEKSIEFRGWGSNPAKALAFLKDDLGNQYKVADLGATSQFPGKIKTVNTEYQTMLIPIARVRPMRSPRLPSAIPPTAAPSIRLAVNRPNQSPASVLLNSEPNKLRDTDSEATGISPSWTPAKTRPAKAANRTARRA